MSKQVTYYDLSCQDCGNFSVVTIAVDDGNHWDASMPGFNGPIRITGPRPEEMQCDKCAGTKVIVAPR